MTEHEDDEEQVQDESTPLLVALNSNSLGARPPPAITDTTTEYQDTNNYQQQHLKTYTAGEESSRLAAVAKELGLEEDRQRKSRAQVRRYKIARDVIIPALAGLQQEQQEHQVVGDVAEGGTTKGRKATGWEMLAGVAGNILEWYDFAIFGYFGDTIGQVFFPPQEGNAQTLESFAVFGGAFLMRPIGGLLLGYLGDVYGRKRALTVSIFLMAFPTFAMGCMPSYERVGYWSTVSLIIIRLLQGMSVGGQLISSLVFTLENVPKSKWGLYGSFVWATGNFGVLLGSLVGYVVRSSFTPDELLAYGWRIPFLLGIVVSIAGFYLKSTEQQDETNDDGATVTTTTTTTSTSIITDDDITENKTKKKINPIQLLCRPENLRPLFASAMVPMMWSAGFYLSFVWMAVYMTDLIDPPVPDAFAVNAMALLLSVCLLFPIAGWLSDKFGRRTIMSIGGLSIAIFSPAIIRVIGSSGNPWLAFGAQTFLGICLSFWGSPMCAWLVESFEPEARLTSVAVGYNVAHAIVGGSTPAIATYLVGAVGPTSPGWIYTTVATIAMIGLWIVAPK